MQTITSEKIPIKMWLDKIEPVALQQARNLANLPFAFKHIAIMPDSHQGYGMPIGGVLATEGVIVPNAVGVDIGCGMLASRLSIKSLDLETIKYIVLEIKDIIPVGFDHQKSNQTWDGFDRAPDVEIIQRELDSARKQLGTLGGGNHFIELQKGDDGHIWVMIHSGSRNFGLKTAEEFHRKAKIVCHKDFPSLPDTDLSFLSIDSEEGRQYFNAMNYCLDFAAANRKMMMDRITEIIALETGAVVEEEIGIHHNYAALEDHFGKQVLVHRKGAIQAEEGQMGIIPGSMGSPSYITLGLGNPESFKSSSHGAGRRMGRSEAKRRLNLKEEQSRMKGIVHGLKSSRDLDEAPGSYKDIDEVMRNQNDLVKIRVALRPLASIKG